jgi:hypothetical protein
MDALVALSSTYLLVDVGHVSKVDLLDGHELPRAEVHAQDHLPEGASAEAVPALPSYRLIVAH